MSARRGHPFHWLGITFVLIALFVAAPLISLFIGGGIADALGRTLPISSAAVCPFMGVDLSDALTVMVFIGYLAFWTVPMATTLFAVWLVIAGIVTLVWWWRRRREA
ncbi:MAG TPA: hypothetical protein VE396_06075 [Xanthobacteraceae bacterium]|jgi:hypothetical protein|nr:hypothetical protein [Xanthobacteraceae bacterium]